jgi:ribokinase
MTPALVLFGCLTSDNVVTADGVCQPQSFGGNAIYAALGARVWSDSVGVVARAGTGYPEACFDFLTGMGIGVEGIRRQPKPHGRNMVFIYSADGSRTRSVPAAVMAGIPPAERHRFSDTTLQPDAGQKWLEFSPDADDMPKSWWQSVQGIHCAAIPMVRQGHVASAARRRVGARVWIQIDSPWQDRKAQGYGEDESLLRTVDALLPSEADLKDYRPGAGQGEALEALLGDGAKTVVLKKGALGCEIRDAGRSIAIPAVAVDAVDPTGAGDAFCGGFLAGMIATRDIVQAARQGTVAASFAVERPGIEGLLRIDRREAARRLASITR